MMMALMKDVSFKGNVETKTLLLNEENLKKNIWISSLNYDIDYINVKIIGIYLIHKIAFNIAVLPTTCLSNLNSIAFSRKLF